MPKQLSFFILHQIFPPLCLLHHAFVAPMLHDVEVSGFPLCPLASFLLLGTERCSVLSKAKFAQLKVAVCWPGEVFFFLFAKDEMTSEDSLY